MHNTPNILKITGGYLIRHFVLIDPTNENYQLKPIGERLRNSLFSALKPYLLNSFVLDLFAGSGIYGFESISRGAKKVFFVEKNLNTFLQITKNVKKLHLDKNCIFYCINAFKFIQKRINRFDIIFIDPPYFLIPTICFWKKIENLLTLEGIIVYRCRSKADFNLPDMFRITREQNHAKSYLFFLKINQTHPNQQSKSQHTNQI